MTNPLLEAVRQRQMLALLRERGRIQFENSAMPTLFITQPPPKKPAKRPEIHPVRTKRAINLEK